MNNEEMFLAILNRMDSMETSLNGRMDKLCLQRMLKDMRK